MSTSPAPVPSVTVAICAFDDRRWDDLVAAVASVRAQTQLPHELLVVIDHNDGLAARAGRELDATVLTSTGVRGLSGARNTALGAAKGELIAFLDDDAVAEPEWLAELCAPLSDPVVLGVGGRAEPRWDAARPTWFPPSFGWVVGCSYEGQPPVPAPVRNLMGCNMVFRTEVLRASGGFREDLGRVGRRPVGNEETEVCIRIAQQRGGSFVFQPSAVVHHRVRPERATWRYFTERCFAEGISKSATVHHVGAADGLSAERAHLTSVLPRAIRSGGMAQGAAILVGVGCAGAGFVTGRVRRSWSTRLEAQR